VIRKKPNDLEINQVATTLPIFMDSYNKSIPESYPHASLKTLKQFQVSHPVLFKRGDEWSIDKHRKKLMDWLPSYSEIL
jgi:hypothetical protein